MPLESWCHAGVQEGYATLTTKTLTFLRVVTQMYNAKYIVKVRHASDRATCNSSMAGRVFDLGEVAQVDDDVYLRLDRIRPAMLQWDHANAGGRTHRPVNIHASPM
jgi:hypothetical protein